MYSAIDATYSQKESSLALNHRRLRLLRCNNVFRCRFYICFYSFFCRSQRFFCYKTKLHNNAFQQWNCFLLRIQRLP